MNQKYLIIIALILSISAVTISVFVWWNSLPKLPEGVKEVRINKGEYETVMFDSASYRIGVSILTEYPERITLRIENQSGYVSRSIDFEQTILTKGLAITFKETGLDFVILWIEKA